MCKPMVMIQQCHRPIQRIRDRVFRNFQPRSQMGDGTVQNVVKHLTFGSKSAWKTNTSWCIRLVSILNAHGLKW